jgi:hypothetical protein
MTTAATTHQAHGAGLDAAVVGEVADPPLAGGTVAVLGADVGTMVIAGDTVTAVGGLVAGSEMPVGPTTLGGESSPEGSWGVGSKDTQPRAAPRYTSGHSWASAPRTVLTPCELWPSVNPTAMRVGRPSERAITAKAPANASHVPARVSVRNVTSGSAPVDEEEVDDEGGGGGVRV